MLGNRLLVCDTFCEVFDLLEPWRDDEFFDFSTHTVKADAIYIIGRAQFNHNLEKVRDIVQNNLAKVILSNPAEGSETLKHHVQRSRFDEYCKSGQLLLLGGGDMEPDYQYLQYDSFLPKIFDYDENVKASLLLKDIFEKIEKPYKFLFLNGRARPNRKYLLHYFKHIGLLEQSIWTNLDTFTGRTQEISLMIDGKELMLETMPLKLLEEKYEVDRYQNNVSKQYDVDWVKTELFQHNNKFEWGDVYLNAMPYVDTYFSVVTETIFTYPYSFRTEKIWKPIAMGHPFIAVANQGYYRDLHNLGFKTFGHVIDESFDSISNNLDRLERIRDVIIDLCKSDLVSFLQNTREICEYNQQHLWHMRDKVRKEFPDRFKQFLINQGVIDE
jgi:hypothetical protein